MSVQKKCFPLACVIGLLFPIMFMGQEVGAQPASDTSDSSILQVGPVAQIGVGLGYGTETGAAVSAYARADGLLGDGHELGFNLRIGEKSGAIDIDYVRTPFANRDDISLGLSISGLTTRPTEEFAFRTDALKVTPRLLYQIDEATALSPFLTLSTGRITNLPVGTSALILGDQGSRDRAGLGIEYRHLFGDAEGPQTLIQASVEVGGSDTGHRYMSLTIDAQHRRSFGPDDRFRFDASFSGGTLKSTAGTSHIGDRTILGQSSIRGFDFGGLGPRDRNALGSPALGGNSFAVLRLEARAPQLFSGEDNALVSGIFLDAGSLWDLDSTAGGPAGAHPVDDAFHFRSSVGLLLDIETAYGTFQMSVAHPIRKMDYDRRAPFNLAYSVSF